MSKFSASDAAFSGFRLVRENPKTIAVWGLLMTVATAAYTVVMIHFFGPQLEALSSYMATSSGSPDPEGLAKVGEGLTPAMLWSLPYSLALNGILLAGINRLVLRREDVGFFHLGFGMAELRQVIVGLLIYVTMMGVLFGGALVTGFLGALGGATGAFLVLVGALGTLGGMVYLLVRLSFSSSATFDSGKITLFRSMPLTKGQFWPLLGAYLLAVVMCVIVFLLLMTIISAVGVIASGNFELSSRLMRADTSSLKAYFSPVGIVQSLFSGVMSVLTNLIIFSPAPAIYKELRDRAAAPASEGGW